MIGKIFTLTVLYFVQGLPYGFQDKFIPMYLRSTGLSHTRLSLMKLLLLPWLCKAGFAPLIDLFFTKWLWLLFSLAALTTISLFGIIINTEYFVLMSIWLLFLNLFSAIQDVSVDALALQLLQECEMGHGNTAQVVGYKLGALFGGGILFWVHFYHGWSYLCLSLASLYIMSVVAVLPMYTHNYFTKVKSDGPKRKNSNPTTELKDETIESHESKRPFSIEESHENLLRKRLNIKKETLESEDETKEAKLASSPSDKKYNICEIPQIIFSTKGTIPAIVFLLLYKLGERGALSSFPLFLVDQGVSTKEIGLWSGIFGQLSSLLGSICGGWLIARKWNLSLFLHYVLIARSGPIFLQWIIVNLWYPGIPSVFHSLLFFFSAASLCALEFTAGLVTTSVFTLMMSCSLKAPPTFQATHYSVLSSVEVAGKLIFSSMSGALIDWMGLSQVYFMFFILSSATVLIIRFID
ncbi:major facilitator superfamily domain-containing protein 3-like [Stegodyphus dumicola]|uniref:major facilitator superfamily domain-containing protein 3-like n=1 Tax=Stegodyphus dumicola TaxID=202533 RepID=UPI0015B1ABA0|nr:major facilitator superfamily domain-containing protein 3-like [Stegodyphus dumicola]